MTENYKCGYTAQWLRFLLILRLSQLSLSGVGAGAELGKMQLYLDPKGWWRVVGDGLSEIAITQLPQPSWSCK